MQVAGYRYSTQGFYNLSDSAYSRMSGASQGTIEALINMIYTWQ
ncbi:TPA: hypothetical protein KAW07_004187 [Escherichia coli]|nr:hypothetical protein [Escherichia coli]